MSEAQQFRARTAFVRALRWDPNDDGEAMCRFLRQELLIVSGRHEGARLEVVRVDGDAWADPGDYVVKGTGKGPLVVKADTFEAMFVPAVVRPEPAVAHARPTVVCLCGSTRFYETWQQVNFDETLAGRVVLSVGFYPHAEDKAHAAHVGVTPEQKVALDELHKRKIDIADEVLILNVGGYIGESTQSEWQYAVAHGKRVRWLEPALAPKEDVANA